MSLLLVWSALKRLPRGVWLALAALWRWHSHQVHAARAAGAAAQKAADQAAYQQAATAAAAAQHRLVTQLAAAQARISQGTANDLDKANADLARRYDDLRLRWAAVRADPRGAGGAGAAALPDTAGPADLAACAAQGWVDFDTAAAAAHAADEAIGKDDAWRQWVSEQAAAWPRND
jgi:hypothetical protein